MNKKRRRLTLAALAVFGAIILGHYFAWNSWYDYDHTTGWHHNLWIALYPRDVFIKDIHMPLFVLAVFYAGLFAILGDNKRKEQ